jgi:N-formylmaleamate deformylase
MKTWTERYTSTNGIRLCYYRTGGEKPAVILVHGITDNGLCWTRLAKALEDQYDVVMFDARGHGLSDKPETGYSPLDHALDLAGLIQALGLNQPAVIGHSMGGMVAAILAWQKPDAIGRLILEDPSWNPRDDDITAEETLQHAREWAASIAQRKAASADEIIASTRKDYPDWDAEELLPIGQAKLQVSSHVTEFILTPAKPWWEIIPVLQIPVLLISGSIEGQVAISPQMMQEINTLNPRIQTVRIAGAGHNVRRDQFTQYLQLVKEFLGRQTPA